ncbi:LCP family protein [Rossellomorea vietnamensis]|uniref:LCP family glycopolymer transferase n=1 Tax=Rossellomorea vietnamensis TaxID=218284 RepID=UPI001CC9277A|nr:LCP family protein [Rossellomorea vietnamensis]MCA0149592.1 LCP family protein [Rossellomorea vietnamensis]
MNKKWKVGITILIGLTVLSGGLLFFVFSKVGAFFDETYEPIDVPVAGNEEKEPAPDDKIHILLMGVDERPHDKGRPDVMMVVEIDPKSDKTKVVSLPRDTKVSIPGRDESTKLNHTYTYGGTSLTVQTVQQLLDINIDYYAKVNMNGFEGVINEVGELTIDNELDFTFDGYHFSKGKLTLSPDEALAYVRMRKQDPLGDEGRNERQRKVIKASVDKLLEQNDFGKILELLDTVSPYLQWNIQEKDLKTLYSDYSHALKQIQSSELPGEGKLGEDGLWYFIAEDPERVFSD